MTRKTKPVPPQVDAPTPPEPVRITPDEDSAAIGLKALENRLRSLPEGTRENVARAMYGAGWDPVPFREAWLRTRGGNVNGPEAT